MMGNPLSCSLLSPHNPHPRPISWLFYIRRLLPRGRERQVCRWPQDLSLYLDARGKRCFGFFVSVSTSIYRIPGKASHVLSWSHAHTWVNGCGRWARALGLAAPPATTWRGGSLKGSCSYQGSRDTGISHWCQIPSDSQITLRNKPIRPGWVGGRRKKKDGVVAVREMSPHAFLTHPSLLGERRPQAGQWRVDAAPPRRTGHSLALFPRLGPHWLVWGSATATYGFGGVGASQVRLELGRARTEGAFPKHGAGPGPAPVGGCAGYTHGHTFSLTDTDTARGECTLGAKQCGRTNDTNPGNTHRHQERTSACGRPFRDTHHTRTQLDRLTDAFTRKHAHSERHTHNTLIRTHRRYVCA